MAYVYPSDPAASTSTLGFHSSPQKSSPKMSRKSSDDKLDIISEFKSKIEEDTTYLQFFQDRIRLEEEYIHGLKKLYSRSKAVDTLHDDAGRRDEKPTTRRAWDEVREYTTREIQAKEALVGSLRGTVVKDLLRLKEEQTRIRVGLKDTIKHANDMYEEHARIQLPRLKRTYWQRCQALEDHKRQEHAIQMQAKLLADSPTSPSSASLKEHPYVSRPMSPPTATGAQPPSSNPAFVGQSDLLPGAGERKGRLRASSASGAGDVKDVFTDLAAHSKKGFNAIMQKLGGDKGDRDEAGPIAAPDEPVQRRSTISRGSDPARGMGTMKGVKVKREAEDADKAYRLGVFHLESLRLRREKLQASAVKNLDMFNDDLNKTLQASLQVYVDSLHATAATSAQALDMPRRVIESINLDRDTSLYRTRLRAFELQRRAPVPYHNFYVGECRSLIFGVSLTDYDFARGDGSDHGRPPTIVEKAIAAIDERGLDAEGIYRISGRHAGVQKMIQDIELDEEKFRFDEKDDVYSISNVLKQYLRELPEPVFLFPHSERVKYTENRETHIHSNFSALRGRLRRQAPIHQTTFQAIVEHLSRIAANSSQNKMDAKNLAVVFNTVLFGQEQVSEGSLLSMHQGKDTLLEDIISNCDLLFGIEESVQAPTLFPPGAAFSRNGVISYHPVEDGLVPGSARTKFKLLAPGDEGTTTASSSTVGPPSTSAVENATVPTSVDAAVTSPLDLDEPVIPVPTFTPDNELDLLFDPSLIPDSLQSAVGANYHVRPLASTDLMRSHFGLLQTLTEAPPIAPTVYAALFAQLKLYGDTYYIVVVVDRETDQMVAHGAVIVEHKYIHGSSLAGHIEDIVVNPDIRGAGLGKNLVLGLRDLAVSLGCYKIILHCKEDRVAFYEKCGFEKRSVGMAYYPPEKETTTHSGSDPSAPPTTEGQSSSDDHPPLAPESEAPGSPGTIFSSTSGVTGITYHFPIPPALDALSPRPSASRQSSGDQSASTFSSDGTELGPTLPWGSGAFGSSANLTTISGSSVTEESRGSSVLPPGAAPPVAEGAERVAPRGS